MSHALGFAPSHGPSDESAEEMRTFDRPKPHLYLVRNESQKTQDHLRGNPTKMYQEISGMDDDSFFASSVEHSQTPPTDEERDSVFAKKALMKYLPSYFYVTNNGWVVPNARDVEMVEVKPYSNLYIFKYQLTNGSNIKFGVVPNQKTNSAEIGVLKESLIEQSYFGTWLTIRNIKPH